MDFLEEVYPRNRMLAQMSTSDIARSFYGDPFPLAILEALDKTDYPYPTWSYEIMTALYRDLFYGHALEKFSKGKVDNLKEPLLVFPD